MVYDKEVYISAIILIKQHVEEAEGYAVDLTEKKRGSIFCACVANHTNIY